MVQRFDNEEDEKPIKKKLGRLKVVEEVEETKPESNIPMMLNYDDLILGELIVIRLASEKMALALEKLAQD